MQHIPDMSDQRKLRDIDDFINTRDYEPAETRGRKIVVDKQIKICNQCKRAWESVNARNHPAGFTIYPLGMIPSYGKKKQTCPTCKRKQELK